MLTRSLWRGWRFKPMFSNLVLYQYPDDVSCKVSLGLPLPPLL
jgi:hypothetical protein